jgi:hypothetical protein
MKETSHINHTRLDLGNGQFLLGCDAHGGPSQPPQGFNVMLAVEKPAAA